jgi:hypothetical protein
VAQSTVVLLSPQRRRPALSGVLAQLGAEGPYAVITAGWEEREEETGELEAHLGQKVTNLRLYGRVEEAFAADHALFLAYRERRARLREQAELYRARLAHAASAWYELARSEGREDLRRVERASAVEALRALDAHQVRRVAEINREFDDAVPPTGRDALATQAAEVGRQVEDCEAVLLAGGNVAVLLNRLRLLGLEPLLRSRPVFAWSAGAMALAAQVVLFHDTPPQGPGHPEVLDSGLGLVRGLTPLPHGDTRLRLEERNRVALFAQRFAPSALTLLDEGSAVAWNGRTWSTVAGVPRRLLADGDVAEVA